MKTINRYLNILMVPLFVVALTLLAGCGASGPTGSADNGSSTALDRMGGGGGGDTTAPLTMASPAGGTYESAEVVVSLSCTDGGGSGCATTYYTYNTDGSASAPNTPYVGPITLSTDTNCVTLRFYSVDNDGNAEAVKSEIYFLYSGGGGGDTTPPGLTTHNPSDNATAVSINMSISATFDEALSAGSISVAGVTGSSSITGSTVTFALSADLAYSTTYNVTVSGAADASSNVAVDHTWSFTTEANTVDNTPPVVSSTTPVNGATNVTIGGNIHAQFDEVLDTTTVNSSTFTLRGPGGSISGTVFDHTDGNIMFTPDSNLANGTTYTATVTTGITDLAGNALASNYSWSFTTVEDTGDTIPPTVSSVSPINGAVGVAVNGSIHAQFSETLDPGTVNTSNFTLSNSGGSVSGAVVDHGIGYIMFTPTSNLAGGTIYTATVTTGITDLAGNALASSYSWSFTTTAGDATPPTVSSVSPANNAVDVVVNGNIHAQFDEALDPGTVNTSNFTLSSSGGSVSGTVLDHGAGYIMFDPTSDLAEDTTYTATVTTGITDLAGNALVSSYSWSFTTVAPSPTGSFDLPPTQPASSSNYSSNTFGLITAGTLQNWRSNWAANKPSAVTGKLVILHQGTGTYVASNCAAVASYGVPYNTSVASTYEKKRNNGLFSTIQMVANGASADAFLKMYNIDPVNDMVVMAMTSYSSTNFFRHGRIYYMLRYWGMAADHLALLNGSVSSNSSSITTSGTACSHPNSGTVTVASLPDNTGLQASTGEMLAVARGDYTPSNGVFLWDVRSFGEFNGNVNSTGEESGTAKVAFEGSIRGAKWLEWTSVINTTTGAFNSKSTLQSQLSGIGYNGTATIYTWCRTSYRAMASLIVGSVIMGAQTKLYDGAWIEWGELTSAGGGGLPVGTPYSANNNAASDRRTQNTNTGSTYPTNKVGSSATTASAIIIADKAYKGITWVPPQLNGVNY